MKPTLLPRGLRIGLSITVAVAWAAFVLMMTLLPNRVSIIAELRQFIGGTDASDAFGHASLFGILTLLSYLALSRRWTFRRALLASLSIGLGLAAATELGQAFTPDRALALSDFLANWTGVFAAGCIAAMMRK